MQTQAPSMALMMSPTTVANNRKMRNTLAEIYESLTKLAREGAVAESDVPRFYLGVKNVFKAGGYQSDDENKVVDEPFWWRKNENKPIDLELPVQFLRASPGMIYQSTQTTQRMMSQEKETKAQGARIAQIVVQMLCQEGPNAERPVFTSREAHEKAKPTDAKAYTGEGFDANGTGTNHHEDAESTSSIDSPVMTGSATSGGGECSAYDAEEDVTPTVSKGSAGGEVGEEEEDVDEDLLEFEQEELKLIDV